ncbi:MAG: hypothetical protein WCP62_17075, partial [Planctomycetota bacterium]
MQWLITIAVVLAALALVAFKLWRFGKELSRLSSGGETKTACHGCPGSARSDADLGITIKPLVQIGDKTKHALIALWVVVACIGNVGMSQEIRP